MHTLQESQMETISLMPTMITPKLASTANCPVYVHLLNLPESRNTFKRIHFSLGQVPKQVTLSEWILI